MASPFEQQPAREAPPCPICEGSLDRVYSRFGENVFVCAECHTGLTVPRKAWDIAATRKKQLQEKPGEKTG
jgi:uncharacterized protein YbbK (DUF523 family)